MRTRLSFSSAKCQYKIWTSLKMITIAEDWHCSIEKKIYHYNKHSNKRNKLSGAPDLMRTSSSEFKYGHIICWKPPPLHPPTGSSRTLICLIDQGFGPCFFFCCFCVVLSFSVNKFPAYFQLGFVCKTFWVIVIVICCFYLLYYIFLQALGQGCNKVTKGGWAIESRWTMHISKSLGAAVVQR